MTVGVERRPHRNREERGGEEGRGKEEIEMKRDKNKSGIRREMEMRISQSHLVSFSLV